MPSALPLARTRTTHIALALGTVVVGLAVHLTGAGLPPAARDIVGDALWAAMMLWWVSALAPDAPLAGRAAVALGICFAVEWSQLHQSPGLDAFRRTRIGHLLLGSGFDPRDFAAYSAGVLAAAAIDRVVGYGKARRSRPAC